MKHFLVFILSLLLLASLLSGCVSLHDIANNNSQNSENFDHYEIPIQEEPTEIDLGDEPFELEAIGQSSSLGNTHIFYRDTVTDVLYIGGSSSGGGISVMWDPTTGLPLTYARYMEMYAAQNPSPSP